MTDFIVLTGFLGSGKTTLLADFLALPEAANTAVIVNEIGEIGLDGAILAETSDVPIAMLANGCICCALAGDLEQTVVFLLGARREGPPLSRIVLETSGLSKPGPILRSLAGSAPLRLRVGVVATVDCRAGIAVSGFEEAVAQWAGAQTLVMTKCDIASPTERQQARDMAAAVNPLAEFIDTNDRVTAACAAFVHRQAIVTAPPSAHHHPRVQVLVARPDEAISWDELADWLDNVAGLFGERLLRLKGVVRVADRPAPVLVQSVGTTFSAPRPFGGIAAEKSFIVLILRDSDPAELAQIAPAVSLNLKRLDEVS